MSALKRFSGLGVKAAGFLSAVACAGLVSSTQAQTQMPLPSQSYSFTFDETDGFWFQAPIDFTITGLQVPADADTGNQSIAVVRLDSVPPRYPMTTNTFTTLYLIQNDTNRGILTVRIPVHSGDYIGILGGRGRYNSIGLLPYTSSINGIPVPLSRLHMLTPVSTDAPNNLSGLTGWLSRVWMYYVTGIDTVNLPHIAVSPRKFFIGPADDLVKTLGVCNTGTRDTLRYAVDIAGAGVSHWIFPDTAAGQLAAGACRNVTLTFNRSGLPPGNTIFPLKVCHNAVLDTNPVSVPCTLFVDSASIPRISVNPARLRIGPTDTTVDTTLAVCNYGTRDTLHYSIGKNGVRPNIVAWTYGADLTTRYPNTVAAIRQHTPLANITTTTTTSAAALSTLLQTADVFLIPAQSSTFVSPTIGTVFRPVLDTFVRRGGIIIALMPYEEDSFLTASGLDSITFSLLGGDTTTVIVPADPLFDGIASVKIPSMDFHCSWTGSRSAVRLASWGGYATCTKQTRGYGLIYLLGFDFYESDTTWARMLDNCIIQNMSTGPVAADTVAGSLAAGRCRNVRLTFNRSELMPGTNVFTIRFSHNSPLSLYPLSVPCTLIVDSSNIPHISVTPRSIRVGRTDTTTRTFTICNTGIHDTLQYTVDTAGTGRRVVPDTAAGLLAAGACRNVTLTFNRSAGLPLGNNVFLLRVRHNAVLDTNPVTVACTLFVDSATVPHISATPVSFRKGPSDPLRDSLAICNSSSMDTLRYYISAGTSSPNILAWTYNSDTVKEYINTVAAIRTLLPSATITTTSTTDPATLSSLLMSSSVFLIPVQNGTTPGSATFTALAPVLDTFVRSGGTVVVLGPHGGLAVNLHYTGLDNSTNFRTTTSTGAVTVTLPTHPVFDSVPAASLQIGPIMSYWTPTASVNVLATYNGYAMCTEQLKGKGAIYLLGADFYNPNTTTWGRMLANVVTRFSRFVSADTVSGNVAAGQCRNVGLIFDRSGLMPGTNVFQIRISNNSPLSPQPVSLPCTLMVDPANVPHISVSPAGFRVGRTDPAIQTFQICNTGAQDTLQYSIDTIAGRPVVADTAAGSLAAGTCRNVALTFNLSGLPPGNNVFQLTIRHNAPLDPNPLSVPCTLFVDPATVPHITLLPASFRKGPTDSLLDTLTICNSGTMDALRYSIAAAGALSPNILAWMYGTDSVNQYINAAAAALIY
jgi:hypothetical protein